MKKFMFILCFLLLSSTVVFGQSVNSNRDMRGKIGLTFSSFGFGGNALITNELCDCSQMGGGFIDLGITYIQPINNWLDFETGIEFSSHSFRTKSMIPNGPHSVSHSYLLFVDIPLTVRVHFLNYLFAQGGVLIDYTSRSSRYNITGIGQMLGTGVEYEFHSGISLFFNPYIKFHSTIPFSRPHVKLVETGLRFGIAFTL